MLLTLGFSLTCIIIMKGLNEMPGVVTYFYREER